MMLKGQRPQILSVREDHVENNDGNEAEADESGKALEVLCVPEEKIRRRAGQKRHPQAVGNDKPLTEGNEIVQRDMNGIIIRCDDLFRDHRVRVLCQIFLRHIPAVERREVGQVIPHPVPLDRFVRGIRDLHPARDRAGLAQILVVIRHLRRDGADKARFIPRRGVLRRLRLVRLFGRSPGDHTDKQDEGDHDQHRDHHTPAVLAHKLPEQFQPLRPLLSARRSRHSLFPA